MSPSEMISQNGSSPGEIIVHSQNNAEVLIACISHRHCDLGETLQVPYSVFGFQDDAGLAWALLSANGDPAALRPRKDRGGKSWKKA